MLISHLAYLTLESCSHKQWIIWDIFSFM